ncbi:MAG TPA: T9SS type A sorting domain-containing protein [Flavilitoribacter sp.]|nr:T9SS type A sorting domain-containing protein [Flavilitoribacter sp.]
MRSIISTVVIFLPVLLFSQIDSEPANNILSGADMLSIGVSNNASINPANDNDFFKFTITQPGVVIISVTNVPANIDMDYEFFNEQGISVYSTNFGDGQNFVIDGLLCNPGTYAFRLGDNEGNPAQYTVRVEFDISDVYECNNSLPAATLIPLATNICASIYDENDNDFYQFIINQPGVVKITVSNVPANIDMDFEFFNEQGISVGSLFYGDGENFVVDALLCNPGIYRFRLADNEGNPAQYCVRVDFDISDNYECNNSLATAAHIPLATTICASIYDENDNDYYEFDITQPGVVKISVFNVPANIDMDYEFFNELGISVGSIFFGDGENFIVYGLLCNPGTYAFRLADNEGNPAQYCVRVDFDTTDLYECNNSLSTAQPVQLATNICASINPENDNDYYKFEITQPGVVKITVFNVPANIDMDYEFFNELGLSTGSLFYGDGENFIVTGLLCNPGTYAFRLADNEGNSAQYCFRIDFDTTDIFECNQDINSAEPILCNVPVFASINPANDKDCYEITLNQPDILTVNVSNVPSNLDLSVALYGPSPSTALINNQNGSTGGNISFTSPQTLPAGKYQICITDNKASESQYTLTVTCPSLVGGINDLLFDKNVKIYPNPASETLIIEISENFNQAEFSYEVRNLLGQIVLDEKIEKKLEKIQIGHLKKGIYIIEIKGREGRLSRQFIKI